MKKIVSKSIEDTAEIAKSLLLGMSSGKSAKVLALSGDLGSGKTAFVKEVAGLLGIEKDDVTSPTFVIMKIYDLQPTTYNQRSITDNQQPTTNNGKQNGVPASGKSSVVGRWLRLVHIDAYRLESDNELKHLGWEKIVSDPKNLILIEWPEMVPGCTPENAQRISFHFVDENTREIEIGENKE